MEQVGESVIERETNYNNIPLRTEGSPEEAKARI